MRHPDVDPSIAIVTSLWKKTSAEIGVSILASDDSVDLDGFDSGKSLRGGLDYGFDIRERQQLGLMSSENAE
jgi:hypothetical protein